MKYITSNNYKVYEKLRQIVVKYSTLTILTLGLFSGLSNIKTAKAHKVCEYRLYADDGETPWILENDFETETFFIRARGKWSVSSKMEPHGPEGAYRDIRYPSELRYPSRYRVGALLMQRKLRDGSRYDYELIQFDSEGIAELDNITDGQYLRFAINEYPSEKAHRNNQGYMTIEIHAEDIHSAEARGYESCS